MDRPECRAISGIELGSELAGQAEDDDLARRQGDGLIRLRIAAFARRFVVGLKLAEPTDQKGIVLFDGALYDCCLVIFCSVCRFGVRHALL